MDAWLGLWNLSATALMPWPDFQSQGSTRDWRSGKGAEAHDDGRIGGIAKLAMQGLDGSEVASRSRFN